MRAIIALGLIFFTASAVAVEKAKNASESADAQAETLCREARKISAEICKNEKEVCTIKDDKQYDEVLKHLKNAPLGGQTVNAAEIKALLTKVPTKESINDLLAKMNGNNSCEVGTYYRLASAVGSYQLKAPQKMEEAKATVKSWLEKDMATEYPLLLSLLVRMKIATQYVSANVVKVSADAKKELDQMVSDLNKEKQKFAMTKEDGSDTSAKWDAKTWQSKIKEEVTVMKKYAAHWVKWLEANWK